MINVELRHERPRGTSFRVIKSAKFEWPEKWDELTPKQYFGMIEELEKGLNADVSHINLFFIISGCSKWFIGLRMKPDEMKIQLIDNLLIPFLRNRSFSLGILRDEFGGYEGMDDVFKNFSWAQYAMVDKYFTEYQKGKHELLDQICALIYRKLLVAFDGSLADEYLPFWSEQKPHVKKAILLHYAELKITVARMYPNLFPAPKNQDEMSPAEFLNAMPKNTEIDYHAATISLSGGPFGTREELDREPVHNVLKYLDMKAKEKPSKK